MARSRCTRHRARFGRSRKCVARQSGSTLPVRRVTIHLKTLMRHSIFLPLVLLAGIRLIAQRPEFIHPEFLESQFAVSEDAPSSVVVAGKDEPGERLVVTGRTLEGNRVVAGVSLFVFHTG